MSLLRRWVSTVVTASAMVIGFASSAVADEPDSATTEGQAQASTVSLIDPATRDGSSSDRAAASCWEIRQMDPAAPDGAYWLLTPRMEAPQRFWCDQTTDGGGWVRIAVGRHQWDSGYLGQGNPGAMLTAQPSPSTKVQLGGPVIDDLLNGQRVVDQSDGIRLRRAMDTDGTQWQEARFNIQGRDRWVWTMGAEHSITGYTIAGVSSTASAPTANFGDDNAYRRVKTNITSAQGYTWGFSYGSGVTGLNSTSSYLWSSVSGRGEARPYTEVYLRPQLSSLDLSFPPIPDEGTPAVEGSDVASSVALQNSWGVNGLAGSTSGEGNVEVQALEQIGSTMYVGGNFRYVQRDAAGTGRVEQPFLAAFDATTGEFIPSFTPELDEAVRSLAALPDGNLAVAGRFTQANGAPATGLLALDPATGETISGWGTQIENNLTAGAVTINSMAVKDGNLYLGGAFTHLSRLDGTGRVYARAAAKLDASTGDPQVWNPEFSGSVVDLDPSEAGDLVYFGGYFGYAAGVAAPRVAAVPADGTGELDSTPWTPTWSNTNGDYQQAIDEVDGRIWSGGAEHSLFTFDPDTYERLSGNITKQRGDFQAIDSGRGQVYAGCHCNQFTYSDAYFWPNVGTSWAQADAIGWFAAWDTATGDLIPDFRPQLQMRLGSGIWALKMADDGTMWAGGDIVQGETTGGKSNWLGGFARFPATDAQAPAQPTGLSVLDQSADSVRLGWVGVEDASRYQVMRDDRVIATTSGTSLTVPKAGRNRFAVRAADDAGNASASTAVVSTGDGNAPPVPVIAYTAAGGLTVEFDGSGSTDDGRIVSYEWDFGDGTKSTEAIVSHTFAATGTYDVRLAVVDDHSSFQVVRETVDVQMAPPVDAYGMGVLEDSPYLYWRLGEGGDVFQDSSGNNNFGNVFGEVSRGEDGAVQGTNDPAAGFDGVSAHVVNTAVVDAPMPYSIEVWFNTRTSTGGKLIGLGRSPSGLSSSYDRHVWMENSGQLSFGAWTGAQNVARSSASYNDGQWHHVVATQGGDGMNLYVDGELVGTNPQTAAESYPGYWRIGGDRVWSGSSTHFQGLLDEAAVYHSVLPGDRVAAHYELGTTVVPNAEPEARFEVETDGLSVQLDASASSDLDGQVTGYSWDFGDGSTGTGAQAGHDYATDGTYQITLTVTDDDGATASASSDVDVAALQPPTAEFSVEVSGASIQVDASSSNDPDGEIQTYVWDFGDGTQTEGATATHDYAQDGTYTVTLEVTDDDSMSATTSREVEIDVSSEPVTETVVARDAQWEWYFGSAAPAAGWFEVSGERSGWSVGGAPLGWGASSVQTNIDIDGPVQERPRASYFAREFEVADPARVVGLELETVANDGVVVYVNGVEVARRNVPTGEISHGTYAVSSPRVGNAERFTVEVPVGVLVEGTNLVSASTHLGYRATPDVTFDLEASMTSLPPGAPPPNQAPVAVFTHTPDLLSVALDGTISSDPESDLVSFEWDLGDGSTASGAQVQHEYAIPGTYDVTLTVTDAGGLSDATTREVTVLDSQPPVTETVVARDAQWEWYFGSAAPAAGWFEVSGERSGWSVGGAPLGWGASSVQTNIDIDGPVQERPRASYFAREFEVADPARVVGLELETVANDGVVVYVNGVEVARRNVPTGEISHGTYAVSSPRVGNAERFTVEVPVGVLVEGTNLVSASTHLGYRATPDVTFDLEATLTLSPQ